MQSGKNSKTFKKVNACLALVCSIFPILKLSDKIEADTALVWSMIFLLWIVINLITAAVFKEKSPGRIPIITGISYICLVMTSIFFVSGMEERERFLFVHKESAGIEKELKDVYAWAINLENLREKPGSEVTITSTKNGTKVSFHDSSAYYTNESKKLFDAFISKKISKEPEIELYIVPGDDPKMYEYSSLYAGNVIKASVQWNKAELYTERSRTSAWSKECTILVPLKIENKKIFVDIAKDIPLTEKKIGISLDQIPAELIDDVRKVMMVKNELKFNNSPYNSVFDNIQYKGQGQLIMYVPKNESKYKRFVENCLNYSNDKVKYLLDINDPYLNKMMFPALSENLQSWEVNTETVFTGFHEMFNEFPYRFMSNLKSLV